MKFKVFSCLIALLLTSCVQRVDPQKTLAELKATKPCCTYLSQAQRTQLTKRNIFGITQKNEAFQFGEDGISYFKLFEMGNEYRESSFCIRSHVVSNGRDHGFFYPKIALLDSNFKIVNSVGPDEVKWVNPGFSELQSVEIRFSTRETDKIHYIIIYTTEKYTKEGKFFYFDPDPVMTAHMPGGLGGAAILHAIVGNVPTTYNGQLPFFGSPVSADSGLDLRVLSSIDEVVPVE